MESNNRRHSICPPPYTGSFVSLKEIFFGYSRSSIRLKSGPQLQLDSNFESKSGSKAELWGNQLSRLISLSSSDFKTLKENFGLTSFLYPLSRIEDSRHFLSNKMRLKKRSQSHFRFRLWKKLSTLSSLGTFFFLLQLFLFLCQAIQLPSLLPMKVITFAIQPIRTVSNCNYQKYRPLVNSNTKFILHSLSFCNDVQMPIAQYCAYLNTGSCDVKGGTGCLNHFNRKYSSSPLSSLSLSSEPLLMKNSFPFENPVVKGQIRPIKKSGERVRLSYYTDISDIMDSFSPRDTTIFEVGADHEEDLLDFYAMEIQLNTKKKMKQHAQMFSLQNISNETSLQDRVLNLDDCYYDTTERQPSSLRNENMRNKFNIDVYSYNNIPKHSFYLNKQQINTEELQKAESVSLVEDPSEILTAATAAAKRLHFVSEDVPLSTTSDRQEQESSSPSSSSLSKRQPRQLLFRPPNEDISERHKFYTFLESFNLFALKAQQKAPLFRLLSLRREAAFVSLKNYAKVFFQGNGKSITFFSKIRYSVRFGEVFKRVNALLNDFLVNNQQSISKLVLLAKKTKISQKGITLKNYVQSFLFVMTSSILTSFNQVASAAITAGRISGGTMTSSSSSSKSSSKSPRTSPKRTNLDISRHSIRSSATDTTKHIGQRHVPHDPVIQFKVVPVSSKGKNNVHNRQTHKTYLPQQHDNGKKIITIFKGKGKNFKLHTQNKNLQNYRAVSNVPKEKQEIKRYVSNYADTLFAAVAFVMIANKILAKGNYNTNANRSSSTKTFQNHSQGGIIAHESRNILLLQLALPRTSALISQFQYLAYNSDTTTKKGLSLLIGNICLTLLRYSDIWFRAKVEGQRYLKSGKEKTLLAEQDFNQIILSERRKWLEETTVKNDEGKIREMHVPTISKNPTPSPSNLPGFEKIRRTNSANPMIESQTRQDNNNDDYLVITLIVAHQIDDPALNENITPLSAIRDRLDRDLSNLQKRKSTLIATFMEKEKERKKSRPIVNRKEYQSALQTLKEIEITIKKKEHERQQMQQFFFKNRKDIENILINLQSQILANQGESLIAIEASWTPDQKGDILSYEELLVKYPDLLDI